jgi:hypothetical protein
VVLAAFLEMGKDEDRGRRNKKADGSERCQEFLPPCHMGLC